MTASFSQDWTLSSDSGWVCSKLSVLLWLLPRADCEMKIWVKVACLGDNPKKHSESVRKGGKKGRKAYKGWTYEQVMTWTSIWPGWSDIQQGTQASKLTDKGVKRQPLNSQQHGLRTDLGRVNSPALPPCLRAGRESPGQERCRGARERGTRVFRNRQLKLR